MYHCRILVTLRQSILDPQGKAVEHGAHSLGFDRVRNIRIGKLVELDVDVSGPAEAEMIVKDLSAKLLSNPVMEDFEVSVVKKV